MKMPFGKYKGQLVEKIIFVHPDYIAWLCRQERYPKFEFLYEYIDRGIETFDNKPFSGVRCRGTRCTRPVKHMTFVADSPTPFFWCNKCDIRKYVPGDVYERMVFAQDYMDAPCLIWTFVTCDDYEVFGNTDCRRCIKDSARGEV